MSPTPGAKKKTSIQASVACGRRFSEIRNRAAPIPYTVSIVVTIAPICVTVLPKTGSPDWRADVPRTPPVPHCQRPAPPAAGGHARRAASSGLGHEPPKQDHGATSDARFKKGALGTAPRTTHTRPDRRSYRPSARPKVKGGIQAPSHIPPYAVHCTDGLHGGIAVNEDVGSR
jgi:hypothetical protein